MKKKWIPSLFSNMLFYNIIKNGLGTFFIQCTFAILSLINAFILARLLGAENYGYFANAMAWITILVIPATFGFGTLLIRDVAIYKSHKNWDALTTLLKSADILVLCISCFIVITVFILSNFLFSNTYNNTMQISLLIATPLIPLFAFLKLRESTLRGFEYVVRAYIPTLIVRPGLLLIGILIVYFIFPDNTLNTPITLQINIAATIIALMLSIFWLKQKQSERIQKKVNKNIVLSYVSSAFPLMIYSGMQIIQAQTSIIMLGGMRSPEEVAQYAIASRIAFLLAYIIIALEMILGPIMAKLYANEEKLKLQKIITNTVRLAFFIMLPIGLIMIFYRKDILTIFGAEYVLGEFALIILIVSRLMHIALGSGPLLLSMTGHEKIVAIIMSMTVLFNIICNAIFIPEHGIIGAAIASTISFVVMRIILSIIATKKTGQRVTIIGAIKNQ